MEETRIVADPGKQEVIIARVFDAPRERVFRAMTDPRLIPQWWGPRFLITRVENMDLRPGGVWRYVQNGPDGTEYSFRGVYHAVEASERLVYTFEFEGMPGHVGLETITFEKQGRQTRVISQILFQSVADRDGMVASGMKDGIIESDTRLAALLANEQLVTH
jgi:uncharacterized protein YndB with AHSA1/START domain